MRMQSSWSAPRARFYVTERRSMARAWRLHERRACGAQCVDSYRTSSAALHAVALLNRGAARIDLARPVGARVAANLPR